MPNIPEIPFNFNVMGLAVDIMRWVFYFIVSGGLIAILTGLFYRFVLFRYKVYYWELYGSTKDGNFAMGKLKTNMARWDKKKKSWQMLYPLFNKKTHPPFDAEYIYPGKICFAYKLNEDFIPGRLNMNHTSPVDFENEEEFATFSSYANDLAKLMGVSNKKYDEYMPILVGGMLNEEKIRASLDPIEYHLRNWHETEIKQNELEFQVESFWDSNKHIFMVLGVSIVCLIMVSVCAWFVYKMFTEGRPDAVALTSALQNVAKGLGGGAS